MKKVRCRRGFTLIELLTVIAIIALLAAVLFPVFNRARAKGHQTTCLSNLSQLGKAFILYMQDSGGFIPTWCIVHNNPGDPPATVTLPEDEDFHTWDAVLMPYIRNSEILKCKANPNQEKNENDEYVNGRDARAYTIAQYTQKPVGSASGQWYPLRGAYRDEIPAPTRTVLLFEKGAWKPTAWGDALGQNVFETTNHKTTEAPPPEGGSWSEKPFHFDGKNILYLDGHAKASVGTQYPFNYNSGRTGALSGDVWIAGRQKAGGSGGDWPQRE